MKNKMFTSLMLVTVGICQIGLASSKDIPAKSADDKPISISGEFERVAISTKEQKILYEYAGQHILWEVEKGVVLINIMQSKKTVLQLKADQKVLMAKTKTKGWQPFSLVSKDIDPELLSILLNNPTFYGKAFIGNALNNKQATELEMKIIDHFSAFGGQTNESVGTTSRSCSCGSSRVTVTCPSGCGIACQNEEREVCETQTIWGDWTGCTKEMFCIGTCRC